MINYKDCLFRNPANTYCEFKHDHWIFLWDYDKNHLSVSYMTREIYSCSFMPELPKANPKETLEKRIDEFLSFIQDYLKKFGEV